MKNYKIKLENGQEVEVSKETYDKILEENNPKLFYNSSSKGKIKIAEMADEHLRNAILKLFREKVESEITALREQPLKSVIEKLHYTISIDSEDLSSLVTEAKKRKGVYINPFHNLLN